MSAGASITAEIMAFHRATEMLRPEDERVCQDPFAVKFLSQEWAEIFTERQRLTALAIESAKKFPGINGAVVARARFIDEIVLQYVEEGLAQIAILGAGYDSRAYRIQEIKENVTVFEVDDPSTQEIKIERLIKIFGEKPGHVRFVPIDFVSDDLKTRLMEHAYDPQKRTLFIMEGLIFYLPAQVIDRIFTFIAKHGGFSGAVVFDYLPPSVINGTSDRTEVQNFRKDLENYGEYLRFGLESNELATFLMQRGFELKKNINAPDLRAKYFPGKSREREITPIFWFAHAAVRGL
ncbi:MAG TPA: class I SAM-dependent methyltransferase [Syntrophales bacterium]|nr:class I SAM-dependent methyltransferase [Syntrophales bacterium]